MLGKIFNNIQKKSDGQSGPEYKRHNDAILVISQDNSKKTLSIKASNERATRIIGLSEREIAAKDLRDLLPPELKDMVNEYIEFEEDGRPIDEILQKIVNFRIAAKNGGHIPIKLRVIRGVSDSDNNTFRLVMNDASLIEIMREARKNYSALSSREFLLRDMQQVIKHGSEYEYESTMAVIASSNGSENLKRAEKMIDATRRDSDAIGAWNENALVYIMPDTPETNSLTPLNRFKNSLPDDMKNKLAIRYVKIDHAKDPATQIKECLEGATGKTL